MLLQIAGLALIKINKKRIKKKLKREATLVAFFIFFTE
jgi:hypothetical protein